MIVPSNQCRHCLVMAENREFHAYLFFLDHCDFDVILGINWLSAAYAIIDWHRRAIIFQISNQLEFEFLCDSGIMETTVARARPIVVAFVTLDVWERQIPIVSDFIDVFSKKYGFHLERSL